MNGIGQQDKAYVVSLPNFHWAWHTHTLRVCECMKDFEIWIQLYDCFYVFVCIIVWNDVFYFQFKPIIFIWIRTWNGYFKQRKYKINSNNQYSFILIGYAFIHYPNFSIITYIFITALIMTNTMTCAMKREAWTW